MPAPVKDRFDEPPMALDRAGAHRAPRSRLRGLRIAGFSALAIGVIVGAGSLYLTRDSGVVAALDPVASEAPPAPEPTVDPAQVVTVLNGTTTAGLAGTTRDSLIAAGWNVTGAENANENDVAATTVFYSDAAQAGAALGVVQALGVGTTTLVEPDLVGGPGRLLVTVGSDLVPPAS